MLAGNRGFLFRGHRAEYPRAEHLGHLHDQPAGAARGGVYQAGVAGLQCLGGVGQVVRRHSLEHDGGGGLEIQVVRDLHQLRMPGATAYSA